MFFVDFLLFLRPFESFGLFFVSFFCFPVHSYSPAFLQSLQDLPRVEQGGMRAAARHRRHLDLACCRNDGKESSFLDLHRVLGALSCGNDLTRPGRAFAHDSCVDRQVVSSWNVFGNHSGIFRYSKEQWWMLVLLVGFV